MVYYLKINGITLKPGAVITAYSGGGGGYGKALERDPETVRQDVIDKQVSLEHARAAYGVVFTDALEVDNSATTALRQSA